MADLERLLTAANFLLTVPEENFNIGFWGVDRRVDYRTIMARPTDFFNGKFNCGFAGCAIGWIAHAQIIPGFKMTKEFPDDTTMRPVLEGYDPAKDHNYYPALERTLQHICKVFDIEADTAKYFFLPQSYVDYLPKDCVTAQVVAGRILDWIKIQQEKPDAG